MTNNDRLVADHIVRTHKEILLEAFSQHCVKPDVETMMYTVERLIAHYTEKEEEL